MSGSFRSYLKSGMLTEVEGQLRTAIRSLETAREWLWDAQQGEDQLDNAADLGGLCERLSICITLIREELP